MNYDGNPLVVDVRALTELADIDVSTWTISDYEWFETFIESYMEINVYPVYELLVGKLEAGILKVLSQRELFAAAVMCGVPLEIDPVSTELSRGRLALRTSVPVKFDVRDGCLRMTNERGSIPEPERTGD